MLHCYAFLMMRSYRAVILFAVWLCRSKMRARHPSFALGALMLVRFLGGIGFVLYIGTLNWYIVTEYPRSVHLGLTMGVFLLPGVLFSFLGGTLIDRHTGIRVAYWTEVFRLSVLLIVGGAAILLDIPLWVLYLHVFCMGLAQAVTSAAYGAALPTLTASRDPDALSRANAWWQTLGQVGCMVGAGCIGISIMFVGAIQTSLIIAAVSLPVLACLAVIPRIDTAPTEHRRTPQAIREVGSALRAAPTLAIVAASAGLPIAFISGVNVVLPLLVTQELHGGEHAYTLMSTTGAAGALCAGLVCLLSSRIGRTLSWLIFANIAIAVVITLFAFSPTLAFAACMSFLMLFTITIANVIYPAYLQHHAPSAILGRVMSLMYTTMSILALPIVVLVGVFSTAVSPRTTTAAWCVVFLAAALALWGVSVRSKRGAPAVQPISQPITTAQP